VLQSRWEILRNPCRQWDLERMNDIIHSCIIMHNMIIQDENGLELEPFFDRGIRGGRMGGGLSFEEFRNGTIQIENSTTHFALRNDLIEHLWQKKGETRF
jgi:hypothetical protein